ncbi:unnamed protein product [Closterium sp. NIES-54]
MVAENARLKSRLAELEGALSLAMQGGGAPGSPAVAADVATAASPASASAELIEEAVGSPPKRQAVPATAAAQQIIWPSPQEEPQFWMRWPTSDGFVAAAEVASSGSTGDGVVGERDSERLHIVHVTAEMAPLAKVGGLGDVVTGLGRACLARGHTVEVMLPFYECLDTKQIDNLQLKRSFGSYFKGDWVGVEVRWLDWNGGPGVGAFSGEISGVPVVLLKPENHFFRGGRIYGGSYNELEAYLFFSRASLEFLQVRRHCGILVSTAVKQAYLFSRTSLQFLQVRGCCVRVWHGRASCLSCLVLQAACRLWDVAYFLDKVTGAQPDILHIHEWHTAAVALLYWDIYHQLNLQVRHFMRLLRKCSCESNVCGHTAAYWACKLTSVALLYWDIYHQLNRMLPGYFGVLNGIDTEMWDPQTDPHLPAHFSRATCSTALATKPTPSSSVPLLPSPPSMLPPEIKHRFPSSTSISLPLPPPPCLSSVSLPPATSLAGKMLCKHYVQRGLGLTPEITPEAAEKLAADASAGPVANSVLTQLVTGERSPLVVESLAHQLFAAADMVLVPSMFEPCGLTQMIGMRYGTVPVVRRTGGLADTVFDVDDGGNKEKANG